MVCPGSIRKVSRGFLFTLTALIGGSGFVAAAAVATSGGRQDANADTGCLALTELLDVMEVRGLEADPGAVDQIAKPEVMAALASCVVRGAAGDPGFVNQLSAKLADLEAARWVLPSEIRVLNSVLRAANSLDAGRKAAALFAATSMIQIAEAAKVFDSPLATQRAASARQSVRVFAEFISSGTASDTADLQRRAAKVARTVNTTLQSASLAARRDMVASLALRLAVFSRSQGGVFSAQTQAVRSMFEEVNDRFNNSESLSDYSDEQLASHSEWLELFDVRLLKVVKQVEPEATSVREAVELWHAKLRKSKLELLTDAAVETGIPENLPDSWTLVELAPDQMRSEVYELAGVLRHAIPEVKTALEKSAGIIDRSMFGRQTESLAALHQLEMLMTGLSARARRTTDPDALVGLWRARDQVKLLTVWTLEAAASRSRTTLPLLETLTTALHRMRDADTPFLDMRELSQVHAILRDQTSEGWVRAFVNRRMAVVYAQSALLLGEAIAIPFSGGASGAAMPPTLHAIVTGLQVVGRGTLIISSSLNIADRYAQEGLRGLVNPASGLDVLTIAMLMPRPVPGPVDATSWFGRLLQSGRNQTASWLHEAGRFAVVGHAAFGAYQLAFAERIASSLRLQGYEATATDVRRQAIGHFAQAFLLGMVEFGEYQRGQVLGGDHHSRMIADSSPVKILGRRLRNMIFPHKAVLDAYNRLAPTVGAPLAAVVSLLPGAAYVAYDYVVASEALMYFYAGSDFGYFAHNQRRQEYPELLDGETAVSFIGFDEADMLYAGAHAIDAHRLEMEKYGDRYFIYDYRSREDFLSKLQEHARTHGPVKYLRFMTHGLPGKLYTGDVQVSAGDGEDTAQRDGWIDAKWLESNRDRIHSISLNAMAPAARTVIFACLVGANLDKPAPGLDINSGDDFLKAFGRTVLSKGGSIDASVRYLIGLDTVYGSMLNWAARDEVLRSSGVNRQPVLPLNIFRNQPASPGVAGQTAGNLLVADDGLRLQLSQAILGAATADGLVMADDAGWEQGGEMLRYAAARMWKMLTQLHKLGIRYGINLEGPWWSTPRYKHAIVEPAQAGSSGSDGVIVHIVTE